MFLLYASLAAPVVGAGLYGWLHGLPRTARVFDACMYVVVPLLVIWQVVEHTWSDYGLLALGVMVLGLALPLVLERISHSLARHTDNLALVVGLSGLLLHIFLEGAALSLDGAGFKVAIVAHRLLVGLMIWWLLRPRFGFWVALGGLAATMVVTLAGFAVGTSWFDTGTGAQLYVAFVGGSLLHVVFHQTRHDHDHTAS